MLIIFVKLNKVPYDLAFLVSFMCQHMNVYLGRDVCYFTFGDRQLVREGFDLYSLLTQRSVTVGHLFRYIISFTSTFSALEQ
jgi:hypothetical protein